ncbi:MAG TPA: hypothetical protein VK461_17060 [Acidimicrobiales bacterium]|nr:hypothetical protein [Acidimicrobiales bacterium]
MQPSSGDTPTKSSNPWRRYGPLIAIVAVIAIIAGILIFASGGNDNNGNAANTTGAASAGTTGAGGTAAAGTTAAGGPIPGADRQAIQYNDAKAAGRTDLTFQDSCDTTTGRLKIPDYYAQPCFANVADNGGATAPGVTADSITVVVYLAPESDPILDFITAAIKNDDTVAQIQQTYQDYTDMMNSLYQTYGRKVVLKFLNASGTSDNATAARADAVKAVEEMGAFAVWGGPVLAPAWTEEIKARGVICLGCPDIPDPSPTVFPIVASGDQTRLQLAEYVTKKLGGKPAQFAGDTAFQSKPRVFGQIFIDTPGSPAEQDAADLKKQLADGGVDLSQQIPYTLDPATLQEQASGVIQKLKAAGVTTVILTADPIAPKIFTEEATKQNYFPEWIYGGSVLVDTNAFGRTYDQQQWQHAFGISSLTARVSPDIVKQYDLHSWYFGGLAPADDTYGVLYPQPALFFAGLQAAGPNLTAQTFQEGLFAGAPAAQEPLTEATITYGDHGLWPEKPDYYGIDDFTEIWWDPNATGQDEIRKEGKGMMQFVDGGKRYFLGKWTSDLKVFDPAGAVVIYDKLPAQETPPSYPPPPGSPAAGGGSSSAPATSAGS